MAAPKVYSLLDRLFRRSQPPTSSLRSDQWARHPNFFRHAEMAPMTADQLDSRWLERVELRSIRQIAELLEYSGAPKSRTSVVLFVDRRCGLITGDIIGWDRNLVAGEVVRRIFRAASIHHAQGIFLLTGDKDGLLHRSRTFLDVMRQLHSKGEAIEVFVLDNLILTSDGWRRFTHQPSGGEFACAS